MQTSSVLTNRMGCSKVQHLWCHHAGLFVATNCGWLLILIAVGI